MIFECSAGKRLVDSYRARRKTWLVAVVIIAGILYSAGISGNSPGFYIDESSIAYNAHTIAETGEDEDGVHFPLYFRGFGEYKNPVYIYLLALLDRLFGPSILLARTLSVVL